MEILSWIMKVMYFYMLNPWLLIPFAIMVLVLSCYKYSNYTDDGYGPGFWRYTLPHAIIDCSVWPIAIISALTWGQRPEIIERIGEWGDSIIAALVIFADTLAFTYFRQGHTNIPLAIAIALSVGIVWRLALWKGLLKQDPEHFFADYHPGHGMTVIVPGQGGIIVGPK